MRALLLVTLLLPALLSRAQPIELDSTFSEDGKRSLNTPDMWSTRTKLAEQSDGKVIVACGVGGVWLMRLADDGSLDSSFAVNGMLFCCEGEKLVDVVVRSDDHVLVVSTTDTTAAIRSYQPNGSVDTNYGLNGSMTLETYATRPSVLGACLQADDRLLLCGALNFPEYCEPFVSRFSADGSWDTTFFGTGLRSFDGSSNEGVNRFWDVLERSDGSVLLDQGSSITLLASDGLAFSMIWIAPYVDMFVTTDGSIVCGRFNHVDVAGNTWITQSVASYASPFNPVYHFNVPPEHIYVVETSYNGAVTSGGTLRAMAIDGSNNIYSAQLYNTDTVGWKITRFSDMGGPPSPSAFGHTSFSEGAPAYPSDMKLLKCGKLMVVGRSIVDGVYRYVLARYHNIADPRAQLDLRVYLGAAFDSTTFLMRDDLRSADLLPTQQPYTAMGFTSVNGTGPWAMPASVLTITGPDAVVDWLWLELLSATDTSTVLGTRVGLLHRDGRVTQANGHSPVDFDLGAGTYFLRVRHRNHLSATYAAPITLGNTVTTVDMISPSATTFGTDAMMQQGGLQMLWPGDATGNGVVKYMGAGNDRDAILVTIGGSPATATVAGYLRTDVNMDGVVKYHGPDNDRDVILQTIGGAVPTAIRVEQVP